MLIKIRQRRQNQTSIDIHIQLLKINSETKIYSENIKYIPLYIISMSEMRIKLAEMKLSGMETEFSNLNWNFNLKLKQLKEQLLIKNKKHQQLTTQLTALRIDYNEHINEVKQIMLQVSKTTPNMSPSKKYYPNINTHSIKNLPKDSKKHSFMQLSNDNKREIKRQRKQHQQIKTKEKTSMHLFQDSRNGNTKNYHRRQPIGLLKQVKLLKTISETSITAKNNKNTYYLSPRIRNGSPNPFPKGNIKQSVNPEQKNELNLKNQSLI